MYKLGGTMERTQSIQPSRAQAPQAPAEASSCAPGEVCAPSPDAAKTRGAVSELYGEAALKQQPALCCPTGYVEDETSHIPKEALDVSYGCGSPTGFKVLKGGETVVDLGSGAGIDCFIAAKKVGPNGKVIGIDMTDNMLAKANQYKELVAKNLGYSNVEFRRGHIEELPVDDNSADLVISNCVINLSYDKQKVFNDIYRVIKDGGMFCVSDIVSDKPVPAHLQNDKKLWGECISGAITREEYFKMAENAGFFGLEVEKSFGWKEIDGIKFISVTLKGYKRPRSKECVFVGQTAAYNGPGVSFVDDEGHTFLRGIPQEVCTETAKRLCAPPYKEMFTITDKTKKMEEGASCDPKDGCC